MTILYVLLESYILLVLFWAVMALRWRWNSIPLATRIIAVPAVVVAVVLDIVFNFTIGTVMFAKLPARGEWTFSQRIGKYTKRIDWRAPVANWICTHLLDPFEVDGAHCKR